MYSFVNDLAEGSGVRTFLARPVRWVVVFAAAMIVFSPGQAEAQGIAGILRKLDALDVRVGELEQVGPTTTSTPSAGNGVDSEALALSMAEVRDEIGGLESDVAAIRGSRDEVEALAGRIEAVERSFATWSNPETRPSDAADAVRHELLSILEEVREYAEALSAAEVVANAEDERNADAPAAVSISGFVDASYFGDQVSTPRSSFGLDQVEIDIAGAIGTKGAFRFDLEWVSDGAGGFALDVEQGVLAFAPFAETPLTVSFGKFNAPIGFELLDAPDMYQFSHALVFDYGLPTNLTGAMVAGDLGGGWDFVAYASNGWDQNTDLSSGKTLGGRIGFPLGQKASGGFSMIHDGGSVAAAEGFTVFDSDITFTPRAQLTLGLELNAGQWASGGDGLLWAGGLAMAHYDVNDRFGLTFRYDYFDDREGLRLGAVGPEQRTAFTFAPTFALGNGMGALIEIRSDRSSTDGFLDREGLPTESIISVAFEMTYTFDQLMR